ncbi:MAG: hypothetical protein ACOXZW_01685 [Bacilli bacterium]|jgi:hypothetical protein|nr:hypothetical protein [Bacilli bacterium]
MKQDKILKFVCSLVENKYIEEMKKEKNLGELDELQLRIRLFPFGWFESSNDTKKIEFLQRAISTKTNLLDLEGISVFDEGIKYDT